MGLVERVNMYIFLVPHTIALIVMLEMTYNDENSHELNLKMWEMRASQSFIDVDGSARGSD